MTKFTDAKVIRAAKWMTWVMVAVTLLALMGAFLLARSTGLTWTVGGLAAFGLFASLGIIEAAVTRVILDEEGLVAVTLLSRKRYPRRDIERVTWETGAGVAIKLVDGQWAQLPDLGRNSQSVTNSIRAWLKRTAPKT
jgi:hypothetical protein